ncbi:MAG: imidazolonepropionase [Chloroflexi bacterium GWB2_54_36]|nr:MAG: imidazolonepropionase [Chloroflexi bacterium GWB2_54_36]
MITPTNMLITNISQLLTLAGGPQRGKDLGQLGILAESAVLVQNGVIEAVGPCDRMLKAHPTEERYNAAGKVVMPGFVDPHTHLVWAGDRAAEFEMRLEGMSYQEIAEAGGGIRATVRATRNASLDELKTQSRARARMMLRTGTTTAEVKTGYALQHPGELTQLQAILELDKEGPLELIPTYLGAHDIPPEYKEHPEDYTSQLCRTLLPEVLSWWQINAPNRPLPFVDVFCETIAFDLEQSRRILEAAKALGFPLKIHADEFDNLGGAAMAARLGATSADHLVVTSPEDIAAIAASDTVAVALPCTPFGLATQHYTPAAAFLEAGAILAIATDLNPGTAWCESMQFSIALACRYMHLTPGQAIAAATINAAAAINRSDSIGSIEVGKQADLLILEVSDYRHLGYRFGGNLVAQVMKRGEFVVF